MESSLLTYSLLCFTSFFTLTNPLGTMPVFLAITRHANERERIRILKRATIIAFFILIAFTVFGQFIFKFFGISSNGFRIVAGLIIFKIGYGMLLPKASEVKVQASDFQNPSPTEDVTITPLAIPILCGPAVIANGIILMDSATTPMRVAVLITVIVAVFVLIYCILRVSSKLLELMGKAVSDVLERLMGLILMVIAVECFVNGIKPILLDVLSTAKTLPM